MKGNPSIDVSLLVAHGVPLSPEVPVVEIPPVQWGDSTQLGVGDRVLIGGFPLGEEMFLTPRSNRMIVQPTFYDGIVSCIVPATTPTETRLLQISTVALGGISGGVVCHPDTGEVLGMVTSGLTTKITNESGEEVSDISLPITYAIPGEVLRPWAAEVSFEVNGEVWR